MLLFKVRFGGVRVPKDASCVLLKNYRLASTCSGRFLQMIWDGGSGEKIGEQICDTTEKPKPGLVSARAGFWRGWWSGPAVLLVLDN